jgi:hypothetical protein
MVALTRKALSPTLTLLTALLLAGPAAAAPPIKPPPPAPAAPAEDQNPDVVEAREHFNRAQALYDEGHADAALLELQRAYALKPNFRLLFNIGSIAFTTHDYVGSLKSFERFLKEGGADVDPGKRAEAESRLVTLRALVGKAHVAIDVDGAAISIDDEPIGVSPLAEPWLVKAGRHRISATKDGYQPANLVVTVLGGEQNEATLHLAPIVTTPAPGPALPPEKPEPSRFTTLSWLGIGASVGLGVGAAIVGASAAGSKSDLQTITFAGATPSAEYTDTVSAVKTKRAVAFALGGAGTALLATTLIVTLTRKPPGRAPASAALRGGIAGTGLFVEGSF